MDTIIAAVEQRLQVIANLTTLGCCFWCMLRILGLNQARFYIELEEQKLRQYLSAKFGSLRENCTCLCCLGLFSVCTSPAFKEQLKKELANANYQSLKDFSLAVQVPIVILTRALSMSLYLENMVVE